MIKIIDKLPDNNLEKNFFWETAFKLRDLEEAATSSIAFQKFPKSNPKKFDNILFMNYGDKHDIPPRTIVFMNADELYRIPDEVDNPNVIKIFKQYCPEGNGISDKLSHMPLGVPTGFKSVAKPIAEREIDISFVGQFAPNRLHLLNVMSGFCGTGVESFFGFTSGFNRGLSRASYSDILTNTKIALCPTGTSSTETFRLYEAASSGCLVITCEQPKNWIYEASPFFTYKTLDEVHKMVENILNLPENSQQNMSERVLEYYNNIWSPERVAEILYEELK